MPLILGQNLRLRFLSPQPMSQRGLYHHFLQYSAVIQIDSQCIRNIPERLVMVVLRKLRVLDTLDACTEGFHERGGRSFGAIGIVGCVEPIEDEHDGDHILNAVVAVGEVVHGLELLVNDADAGFVRANRDVLDIFGGFAPGFELGVDVLCGFDGGLRVEFRWEEMLVEDFLVDGGLTDQDMIL